MTALLLLVAGIHLVALATPGPDFFFVSQVAVSRSRQDGLKAVLGIVLGVFVWAGIALLGLHVILQKMAWLQKGIMLAGGAYLCYLAYLLIKSALQHQPEKLATEMQNTTQQNLPLKPHKQEHIFIKGLLTNLSNPKAVIFFGSVFAALIGDDVSSQARLLIFALILVETFLWFSFVAFIFALPPVRKGYKRLTKWIDGFAGLLFAGFGGGLIYKSLSS